MAEETINRGIRAGVLEKRKCVTRDYSFYSPGLTLKSDRLKIYGSGAVEIEKMIEEKPGLGELLDPRLPYTRAEIVWICHNEMPLKLEDMLARRTRSLVHDARASSDIAPEVAAIMARELKHDDNWVREQIKEYHELLINYL